MFALCRLSTPVGSSPYCVWKAVSEFFVRASNTPFIAGRGMELSKYAMIVSKFCICSTAVPLSPSFSSGG